ncbi:MAG: DUF3363 domain-containing protein [Chlorobium limicola]|nr:DUF3363 domain-containing protein [Chlorobium limicola]
MATVQNDDFYSRIRPKIGGRTKKEKAPSLFAVGRALKPKGKVWRKTAYVRQPKALSRRVTVKSRMVKMTPYGIKAALLHIKYIERHGVEQDGSEGKLYGRDEEFQRDEFTRIIPEEKHQFRFIVSPEDAGRIDLKSYTRELMQQFEKDQGRKVEWAAVNHYNTDNPHVHIVIRGVDHEGELVTINRDYITSEFRYRAQEIATDLLGPRTELEIAELENREIGLARYTSLDSKLARFEKDGVITLENNPQGIANNLRHAKLSLRMFKLSELGLAESIGKRQWKMQENWQQSLRDIGRKEEIYKVIHEVAAGDPQRYRINDVGGKEVQGKVLAKRLRNELDDRYYMIVQEPDGTTHYLDLDKSGKQQDIKSGEFVSVKIERESWLKTADKNIASIAGINGGIYSAEKHLATIQGNTIQLKDQRVVDAKDFVSAHELRLFALQRLELAVVMPDGEWQIDPDMVNKLIMKDKTEGPRELLKINSLSRQSLEEQISYKGRTWLDRFTASEVSGFSHYGLGQQMQSAVRRRIMMLQEMGIDPLDSARARKLDKIEKNMLAEKLQSGGSRYRNLPDGMRMSGVIEEVPSRPNGKRYAQVTDPKSREFTLVPWQQGFEKLSGKSVEIMNQAGKMIYREITRTMGR